ncbi:MAG: MFS transporter [Pseudomonadota bacterium]
MSEVVKQNNRGSADAVVSLTAAAIAFALGSLFFNYAFVQRVAPSVMTQELMRDFSVGAAALGSLSAFYFYVYAALQLPVGLLTDRFGPRKLMGVAAFLCAFASAIFAYSDSLWLASLSRGLIGGTVAFAFVGTMAIAGYWFKPSHYAMLAGVLQSVGMCGAIFGQALLRHVVEAFGWRGTILAMAVIAVIISILIFLLVPKRTEAQKQQEQNLSDLIEGLRAVVRNRQTWLCAMIGFGMAASMLAFGGLWAVPWLRDVHGFSSVQAAGIASTLFAGWAIFSPIVGWASDRIGLRKPIITVGGFASIAAIATLVFATPSSPALIVTLMFATGAFGSVMTIAFSSVKELNDLHFSSTALGFMNMCIIASGALMQPLIGWLLDIQWDGTIVEGVRIYHATAYTNALASFLIVNALALTGALLLRETRCKQLVE